MLLQGAPLCRLRRRGAARPVVAFSIAGSRAVAIAAVAGGVVGAEEPARRGSHRDGSGGHRGLRSVQVAQGHHRPRM